MIRNTLAVLAAAALVFCWGFLSWAVLPWHQPLAFENEAAVVEVLKANTPKHGIYGYPAWAEMQADDQGEDYMKKWQEGPSIYAMVRPGAPRNPSMSASMITGFLINVLAATALLLLIQKSGHTTFLDRVSIALLAGLFLGIVSALYPWNWLEAPGRETLATLIDGIVPWTLAGAVIAAILPSKPAP